MKKTILLIMVLILTGCSSLGSHITQAPSAEISQITNTPTSIPMTPTPMTPTPKPGPALTTRADIAISLPGDIIPTNREIITADNVNRLKPIAVLGPGTYYDDYFWSPSQKLFAVSREAGFEIYDLATSQSIGAVSAFGKCTLLGFTSEDTLLLEMYKTYGNYLAIYSLSQKEYVSIIGYKENSYRPANQVLMSTDRKIAAADENGWVTFWNLTSGERTNVVEITEDAWLFWLSPKGDQFITLGKNLKDVKLWSSTNGGLINSVTIDKVSMIGDNLNPQPALWVLQDGALIVEQSGGMTTSRNLLQKPQISSIDICADCTLIGFTNDGKVMGTTNEEKTFQFWNPENGKFLSEINAGYVRPDYLNQFMFSSDSTKFFTFQYGQKDSYVDNTNSVSVWNISDGTLFARFSNKPNYNFFESSDGKYLIPYAENWTVAGSLVLGNLQDGTYKVVDYAKRVNSDVAVSPDGSHIAVYSFNETANGQMITGLTLKIGNLETGDLKILRIPKDWGSITRMTFSPDSSTLAVSSYGHLEKKMCTGVAFWDMDGNLVTNICFNVGPIYDSLQFSRDSSTLLLYHFYQCEAGKHRENKAINLFTGVTSGITEEIDWMWLLPSVCGDRPLLIDVDQVFSIQGDLKFVRLKDIWWAKLAWENTANLTKGVILPEQDFDIVGETLDQSTWHRFYEDAINNMVVSPDGSLLATINRGTAILWAVLNQ